MPEIPVGSLFAAGVPNIRNIGNVAGTGPTPGGGQTAQNARTSFDFSGGNNASAIGAVQPSKQQNLIDPASQALANRITDLTVGILAGITPDATSGGTGAQGLQTILANGAGADAEVLCFTLLSAITIDPVAIGAIWSEFGGRKREVCFVAHPAATAPVTLTLTTAFDDTFAETVSFVNVTATLGAGVTAPALFNGAVYPMQVNVGLGASLVNPNAGGNIAGPSYIGIFGLELTEFASALSDGDTIDTAGGGEMRLNVNQGSVTSTSGSIPVGANSQLRQCTASCPLGTFSIAAAGPADGECVISGQSSITAAIVNLVGNGDNVKVLDTLIVSTGAGDTHSGVDYWHDVSYTKAGPVIMRANDQTLNGVNFAGAGTVLIAGLSAPTGRLAVSNTVFAGGALTVAGGTEVPFANICFDCVDLTAAIATINGGGVTTGFFTSVAFGGLVTLIGVGGGQELVDALVANSSLAAAVLVTVTGTTNFPNVTNT